MAEGLRLKLGLRIPMPHCADCEHSQKEISPNHADRSCVLDQYLLARTPAIYSPTNATRPPTDGSRKSKLPLPCEQIRNGIEQAAIALPFLVRLPAFATPHAKHANRCSARDTQIDARHVISPHHHPASAKNSNHT